jgi:hypothetical protein
VAEVRQSKNWGQKAVFHYEKSIKKPPSIFRKAAKQTLGSKIIYCKD